MKKIVFLKTYPNRIEADIAKGFLEENGIKAMISADDAGGMRPDMLWGTGGARLMVREGDREEALRLLEEKVDRQLG